MYLLDFIGGQMEIIDIIFGLLSIILGVIYLKNKYRKK